MTPEEICSRYNKLVNDRSNLDGVLEIISKFFMPLRSEFFKSNNTEQEVDWRNRDVYDSTAVESVDTLSASMQGALTSMAVRWFELVLTDDEIKKDKDAQLWIDNATTRMWQAIQQSNFDIEASEYYIDLVGYATAIMTQEVEDEATGKFTFKAIPIDSCQFEEDHNGRICKFYRKLMWTPLQIVEKFGPEKTPKTIREKNEAGKMDKEEIIFCIWKRKYDVQPDVSKKLAPSARPYGFKYVCAKSKEQIGEEGGYYEMPSYVSRWRKTPGSVWGYGPAHLCLSDVLTLNELTSDLLEAAGKAIDPSTVTTNRNLLSDLDLGRGGLTVVRNVSELVPFESRARFDVGELKIDRLQEAIRRAFRVDQLQLKDSPAMTATESQIRYELMQRLLGPTLGRLKNDFLNLLIERTFNILFRAGQFGEMPEVLKSANIDIVYTGPMARSQRSQIAVSIQQWIGGIASLAEVYPEAMDVPNPDAIVRGLAELAGVPAAMTRGDKEVKMLREERQQKQNQAEDTANAAGIAAAAKDGASAVATLEGIRGGRG